MRGLDWVEAVWKLINMRYISECMKRGNGD